MVLKIYLLKKNITLSKFSEMIGYSRVRLSCIINGKDKCSKKMAILIEKMTDGEVKAEELMNMS